MSPSKSGKKSGNEKEPRKRKIAMKAPTDDQDPDSPPKKMKVKFNFPKKRTSVMFDRFLIFDIGLKISETRNYQPIMEVM